MLAIVIAVLMTAVFVPVVFSDGAAADEPSTVINFQAIATPVPDEFDTVRVTADDTIFNNVPVDTDGKFSVSVPAVTGEVNISVVMARHGTIAYIYDGDMFDDGVVIDLAAYSGTVFVMFGEGWPSITGIVVWQHNNVGVGAGVTVTAYDEISGSTYFGTTRANGTFEIICPVNVTYVVSVVHRVYEAPDQTIYLGPDGYELDPFVLIPKKSATVLFGFDLTHSMMIIGGIAGLFLLIFVILYRIHIGRHPERSKIHSDSKKKDQE
jgi:hypothetical protein